MKKLLVTGFAPFGGESINPSYEAVKRLPDALGDWTLLKKEIPVSFMEAPRLLRETMDKEKPDGVLLVGQAGGRKEITPEQQAMNLMEARAADNDGFQPQGEPLLKGGEPLLQSTGDPEKLTEAIVRAGVPARLSPDAGKYVCNALYYSALAYIQKNGLSLPAVFIHVPYVPAQTIGREYPSLPLETIEKALQAAILAL